MVSPLVGKLSGLASSPLDHVKPQKSAPNVHFQGDLHEGHGASLMKEGRATKARGLQTRAGLTPRIGVEHLQLDRLLGMPESIYHQLKPLIWVCQNTRVTPGGSCLSSFQGFETYCELPHYHG